MPISVKVCAFSRKCEKMHAFRKTFTRLGNYLVLNSLSLLFQVKGDESCVVETEASGENCASGSCKQTCTVTPVKVSARHSNTPSRVWLG